MCEFTVIGISDSLEAGIDSTLFNGAVLFSGGRRHHALVADLLPPGAEWLDIAVPLHDVFESYRKANGPIVVFASGDPLFFGFASTLRREFPSSKIRVIPTFNSLQTLAHRLVLPYHEMHPVSLTGRPWPGLDSALIGGEKMIGVLTDRTHTPAAIASRLLDYGYDNYRVHVGENLGNPLTERVSTLSLTEVATMEFDMPNCLILEQEYPRPLPFGIPENEFALLDGRVNMITKMPVRLLALSMLDLGERSHLWDIGFCTGSVSIEARLRFPHLVVTAFEIREGGGRLIHENARRFGAPGIDAVIGDFMEIDLSDLTPPDAVFIGGHGGRLREMLERISSVIQPGGSVVFNSVTPSSLSIFTESAVAAGFTIAESHTIALDNHNPITIIKAVK
ncbi:MAG: precorrin-6y C5,15-methyltransferase (decarboxylating) subunit CbiE [Muribaculaceae bacterium]|nr:precorrin-6y C5,15-methyltransferase (decarboxylating) subunit CbiE [Muribaculaceae bacterium]